MVDWSATGRKSKSKGKAYERAVAAALTEFTGVNYRKTPSSGGFNRQGVTVAGHIFCGDLMCDRADFKFSVEAKNRKIFLYSQAVKNPETAPFTKWYFQTIRDAKDHNLEPMMWFKPKPGSPDNMIVLCQADWAHKIPNHYVLTSYSVDRITEFTVNEKGPGEKKRRDHKVVAKLPTPILVDSGYFFSVVKPEELFGTPSVKSYGEVLSYD